MNFVQSTLILGTLGLAYGPLSTDSITQSQESPHTTQTRTRHLDLRDAAKLARISLLDAMKTASQAQGGTIVEAGLEGEVIGKKREVFFEIMILDGSDTLHEVKINPASGAIMEQGTEDDQEEVSEFKAVIRNSELDLGQLIQKATTIIKGAPLSAALQMEEEGPECEIVLMNTRYLIEASLETRAGHLVDLELMKDGDNESEENSREGDDDKGNQRGGSKDEEDDDGDEEDDGGEEEEEEEEGEHNEKVWKLKSV